MNKYDPMEALDAFYASCHEAIEPARAPSRARLRLVIPALGTALGVAAAILIASFSSEPSAAACENTAQILAKRQLAAEQSPATHQGLNQQPKGRKPWTA